MSSGLSCLKFINSLKFNNLLNFFKYCLAFDFNYNNIRICGQYSLELDNDYHYYYNFNWILDDLRQLIKRGSFKQLETIKNILNQYKLMLNDIYYNSNILHSKLLKVIKSLDMVLIFYDDDGSEDTWEDDLYNCFEILLKDIFNYYK